MTDSFLENDSLEFMSGALSNVLLTASFDQIELSGNDGADDVDILGVRSLVGSNTLTFPAADIGTINGSTIILTGTCLAVQLRTTLNIVITGNEITGLDAPTLPDHAANKAYVDSTVGNSPPIFYAYDITGDVDITMIPQTLDFDQTVINDTGYSESAGEITIANIGTYEISYTVATRSTETIGSNTRGKLQAFIEWDQGGGFFTVNGSVTSGYLREDSFDETAASVSKTIPLEVTVPNTVVRIQFYNPVSTTKGETAPGESTIYIKKVK